MNFLQNKLSCKLICKDVDYIVNSLELGAYPLEHKNSFLDWIARLKLN